MPQLAKPIEASSYPEISPSKDVGQQNQLAYVPTETIKLVDSEIKNQPEVLDTVEKPPLPEPKVDEGNIVQRNVLSKVVAQEKETRTEVENIIPKSTSIVKDNKPQKLFPKSEQKPLTELPQLKKLQQPKEEAEKTIEKVEPVELVKSKPISVEEAKPLNNAILQPKIVDIPKTETGDVSKREIDLTSFKAKPQQVVVDKDNAGSGVEPPKAEQIPSKVVIIKQL